jgi:DNA-binding response OmpR family regulator
LRANAHAGLCAPIPDDFYEMLRFTRRTALSKKVLIIDDEPEIRRNLTLGLTQEGFDCTACPDGLSAIHELSAARAKGIGYNYLITDIFMPDIDGLKILKVIKNEFPDLPVLVITGFGDEFLKSTALGEHNTGYLDKPFEIPELVAALNELAAGTTTLAPTTPDAEKSPAMRESVTAYMTVRVTDPDQSLEIYNQLFHLDGIVQCDAVRGDMDIIILAQADSQEHIKNLFDKVRMIKGIEVASMSPVERPKLDRDVKDFIDIYQRTVRGPSPKLMKENIGTTSYIIVDIDKNAIQQIFTTVFFVDEVIFCDVIDNGTKLVGMITESGAVGKTPRVIEKLSKIDGVLRVREAKVIRLMDA